MTDENGRTLEIPLSFLGSGNYVVQEWADAYEAADYPDRVRTTERSVTAGDIITAKLAGGGGHVMRIAPAR